MGILLLVVGFAWCGSCLLKALLASRQPLASGAPAAGKTLQIDGVTIENVAQKLSADADSLSAIERLAIDRALLLSDAINQSFLVLDQCHDLDGRIAQLGMIRYNLQQLRELCKQNTCLTVNLDQIQSEFERRIRSGLPPQLTNS